MKAILCTRYGPPEVLQLQEVEKPIPSKNEVCIKIYATTVTASDTIIRGFKVKMSMKILMGLVIGFRKPRKPILGMICTGEIESVGQEVTQFKPGDAVFTFNITRFGTYAEYVCLPQTAIIAPKPVNLSYEEAAAIPYGGMLALHFLKKADIQNRHNVLIYGASGAIGTAAVQLAKYYGTTVTGVCSTRNLDMVTSLGADHVIDYTQQDFTQNSEHYDLILNAVGKRKARLEFEQSLTPDGMHITVDDGSPKLYVDDLVFLKELAEAGHIQPVIDRCYPLAEMVEAHRHVDTGHKKGNVVITVRDA